MAWCILFLAGLFEIVWAVSLKYSDGMTNPLWAMVTLVAMIFSVVFLALAVRTLPLGTAYAVWTGIGVVGTVVYGLFFFGEPMTLLRLLFLMLIVAGIIGLKLVQTPALP